MSNLYQLQAKIHELLPQINQKYGLEIEIESKYDWVTNPDGYTGNEYDLEEHGSLHEDYLIAIQAPQIRQILIGLQEVLGENPKLTNKKKLIKIYNEEVLSKSVDYINRPDLFLENFILYHTEYTKAKSLPQSQAQALDDKWFRPSEKDGKYTGECLFDREPEKVLQELVEILENLLK